MGAREVVAYLEHLAVRRTVAVSTQNQALSSLLFTLRTGPPSAPRRARESFTRARRPRRLPVVLTRREVARVNGWLSGVQALMAGLLHGSGMRLMECVRLRVQDLDLDFDYRQKVRRHHLHENTLQRSIKRSAQAVGLSKRVNCHALRHSFATHLLEAG